MWRATWSCTHRRAPSRFRHTLPGGRNRSCLPGFRAMCGSDLFPVTRRGTARSRIPSRRDLRTVRVGLEYSFSAWRRVELVPSRAGVGGNTWFAGRARRRRRSGALAATGEEDGRKQGHDRAMGLGRHGHWGMLRRCRRPASTDGSWSTGTAHSRRCPRSAFAASIRTSRKRSSCSRWRSSWTLPSAGSVATSWLAPT